MKKSNGRRSLLKKLGLLAAIGTATNCKTSKGFPGTFIQTDQNVKTFGFLSVTDFGATGDGKTDDTRGIQAALDSAMLKRKAVFIPEGVYIVSETLVVNGNCAGIKGSGMGSTTRRKSKISFVGDSTCIRLTKTANYLQISDLSIEKVANTTETVAIEIECTKIKIQDTLIAGFTTGIGKFTKGTLFDIRLINLEITNCTYGVDFQNSNNTTLSGCLISSCHIGLNIVGGANHIVDNGSVIQIFGNASNKFRKGEKNDSTCVVLTDVYSFSCINCYFETGSLSNIHTNQRLAVVTNVKGFNFANNYCVSSAGENPSISPITFLKDNFSVNIDSNVFHRFPDKITIVDGPSSNTKRDYVDKLSYRVSNNTIKKTSLEIDRNFEIFFCHSRNSIIENCSYAINTAHCYSDGNYTRINGSIELKRFAKGYDSYNLSIGPFPLTYTHKPKNLEIICTVILRGKNLPLLGVLRNGSRFLEILENDNKQIKYKDILNKRIDFTVSYPYKLPV